MNNISKELPDYCWLNVDYVPNIEELIIRKASGVSDQQAAGLTNPTAPVNTLSSNLSFVFSNFSGFTESNFLKFSRYKESPLISLLWKFQSKPSTDEWEKNEFLIANWFDCWCDLWRLTIEINVIWSNCLRDNPPNDKCTSIAPISRLNLFRCFIQRIFQS